MRSFRALVDLVLPSHCAGCASPDGPWCPVCARCLAGPVPVSRASLPPAYALAPYEGPVRRAVIAYKERSRRELAGHLARPLAAAIVSVAASAAPARAGPLVLVPAPSRPSAARRRGGQHMAAVAERCVGVLGRAGVRATVSRSLRLDGRARDSVGLNAGARAANLAGRLRPVPGRVPPPGARVVLLDDVITTGATALACVAALAAVGAEVTAVLAIAAVT